MRLQLSICNRFTTMARPRCIVCKKTVTVRQHALLCENCDQWQHRLCDTGISEELYRQLVRQEEISFYCRECGLPADESSVPQLPDLESTRISAIDEDESSFTIPEEGSTVHLDADQSFDVSQRSFDMPDIIQENSILDDSLPNQLPEPSTNTHTYTVVDNASQRGKRKLVDIDGYMYTVKKQKGDSTTWWCSVRNQTTQCSATVIQKGSNFRAGRNQHCHTADPGTVVAVKITAQAKTQASADIFTSSGTIVETAIRQYVDPSQPAGSRVHQDNLLRVVNRTKQKLRPDEPEDLNFELAMDFIPSGFLQKDIQVDIKRHILFATDDQLTVLKKAQRWFVDGTFKIVKEPFTQLLTIHAFITANNSTKMVPLAFVLMSRRRKIDYVPVFQALKDLLPAPSFRGLVADFEPGVWQAFREVFPGLVINGCLFHFTQAIFRHVQELGLQPAYREQDSVFKYIRKLMALPFLPAEHIQPAFRCLRQLQTAPLQRLVDYVETNWIHNTIWPVESWSVYNQPTRTNNDVEGWHRCINKKATDEKKPFYLLVPLLHEEATLLPTQLKMVTEAKLTRQQRSSSRYLQSKFFEVWELYENGQLSASQLLRTCGQLNGPSSDR